MTKEKLQHNVVVRKDIKLATGETLRDFTQKLSDGVRKFMFQKLSLGSEKASVFTEDVFSTALVVEVFKFGQMGNADDRRRFFAMKFTRDDKGTFQFSNMIQVERVTSFRPKETGLTPTTKSKDDAVEDTPVKKALDVCEGWLTQKQLWGDVL